MEGGFGAEGIEGIPDAGAAFAPQWGQSSAKGLTSPPHLGHLTGASPITAGLKHMRFSFLIEMVRRRKPARTETFGAGCRKSARQYRATRGR